MVVCNRDISFGSCGFQQFSSNNRNNKTKFGLYMVGLVISMIAVAIYGIINIRK